MYIYLCSRDQRSHAAPSNKRKLRLSVCSNCSVLRSPPGLSGHSPGNSMVGSPPPSARPGLEELADSFAASFTVTNNPNDTARPHPRFAQYKMKSSSISQEARRKKLLEHQKSRRDDLKNFARCLAAGDFDEEKEEEDEEEDMDTSGEVSSTIQISQIFFTN